MNESLEEKIIELEKKMFEPDVRKSADELNKYLANKFVEFGSTGEKYNREQIISSLNKESGLTITATDFDFEQISSEIVLLTYRVVIKHEGAEGERRSLRSSTWKLIDNRWQMLFHQGTPTTSK